MKVTLLSITAAGFIAPSLSLYFSTRAGRCFAANSLEVDRGMIIRSIAIMRDGHTVECGDALVAVWLEQYRADVVLLVIK